MKMQQMQRRDFIRTLTGGGLMLAALPLVSCGYDDNEARLLTQSAAGDDGFVTMYDTYAMATYFDGSLGPKTGIIKVDYILANKDVEIEFWHGHGGKQHRYTVKPEHFAELKLGKRVVIETTAVDSHTHKLFIDPNDSRYRVPGAPPVQVPK